MKITITIDVERKKPPTANSAHSVVAAPTKKLPEPTEDFRRGYA